MQYPTLLEKYAAAIIASAQTHGFTVDDINRALNVPLPQVFNPDDLPASTEAIERFQKAAKNIVLSECKIQVKPDLEVTPELFLRLQRNIKLLLNDDFYGLTRHRCKAGAFGVLMDMVYSCRTLRSSLEKGIRFYRAITDDVSFALRCDGQFAEFVVEIAEPERDEYHFLVEWWLLLWHRLSCWLIGEMIPVLRVDFPYSPNSPLSEYATVFSSNCRFGSQQASMCFSRHFLDKHNARTDEDVEELLHEESIDFQALPGMYNPLSLRIEVQLEHHFNQSRQFLTMEQIADTYHISTQTLRRRLDDEGTSYRIVKETIRRKAALRWLEDPDLPVSEIAQMTGFAEANGLSRAVKAWTGLSPTEYRARLRKDSNNSKAE